MLQRPNLDIATNTVGEKILFSIEDGVPRAIGVQVSTSNKAKGYSVRARKEVVLSAGAISSPHLLFVSGIGSQEELESVGVPLIKNLPAVGKHFLNVSRI